ncbi:hypothetical protein PG994_001351 [Apiospora phragmitis]|uniref:Uncharacterized protein n=1 Tax=Apiospora phragmitis TaxID=2905665 RepID=A0ABR1WT94_9PEZI
MPPPNTPEEGLVSTPTTATLALRPITRDLEMTAASPPTVAIPAVDLRALEYESNVDENLICPICRVALVAPVITNCDHVFCQKCLVQAHTLNPVCPVDRQPLLKLSSGTRSAPKLIANQLDNLTVRCPNRPRGCDLVVARSLVENHVSRYCDKTLVPCPHPSCNKTIARKDMAKGCLHYEVSCEFCEQAVQKADLETHQDMECLNRKTDCELCGAEFVRSKQEEHTKECPEVEVTCKFAPFGCNRKMSRRHLEEHCARCDYRVVGPVGEQLAELRAEMTALKEKDRLKDRRIKFLENRGYSAPAATENISNMNLPAQETAPYESRDQYFLSLFETMESKVERLSSALTEVEGRHSMMLFNETMPIKDQLTEIRSTMGVLGMHVRWLMNFRLQERGRVLGSGGANSPSLPGTTMGASQESSSDSNLPRRLSDTMREHPPRL